MALEQPVDYNATQSQTQNVIPSAPPVFNPETVYRSYTNSQWTMKEGEV